MIGPAATLREALKLIEGTPKIDGAVLDIRLPDGNVFPAAETFGDRGIPIILHSGFNGAMLAPLFSLPPCGASLLQDCLKSCSS